jgi:protein O-GlcNAc transferase
MTDLADAHARLQAGDIAGAEEACRRVLKSDPAAWPALQVLGLCAQRRGDPASSEGLFAQALRLAPKRADLLRDRGTALVNLGRLAEGIAMLEASLALDPRDLAAINNLGIAHLENRAFDSAIAAFQRALAIDPALVAAVNNLGNVYRERGDLTSAESWYRRAVALEPGRASALNNLSVVLRDLGRLDEAIAGFRRASTLDPTNIAALSNLAATLAQTGERDGAIEYFRRALRLDPRSGQAATGLLQELTQVADWPAAAETSLIVDGLNHGAIGAGRAAPEPAFHNITRSEDPVYNLRVARSHSLAIARRIAWLQPRLRRPARDGSPRIRIGYLSADIWDHPIAHLSAGLFEVHDRKRFAVHVYAYGRADESVYRQRIAQDAERFIDIDRLDNLGAAQRIADDGIDILVELTGHTSSARLEIAALRPAPLQIHWLGYPGSIGGDFLDYLIADRTVVPPEHLALYREKIIRLPHSYQANWRDQPIEGGASRAECGLPDGALVLCSFNQISKIEPRIFDAWMTLMLEVPDSVLWLLAGHASATVNLREAAALRAIAPKRLIFAPKLPKPRHLGRIGLADLALDTLIYNGHTTTSDALFAGLPVITVLGRHFASRVSASLLATQGLGELVAADLEGYLRLARCLTADRAKLAALRRKVASARLSHPLFDTARFARNLEAAYEAIWARRRAGAGPAHIDVVEPAPPAT